MKKTFIIGGGYSEYSAPSVAALEVAAEKGFAQSDIITGGLYGEDSLPWLEDGGTI